MSSTRIALLALTLAAVALAVVAVISGAFLALVLTVFHPSLPEVSVVFDVQRVTGLADEEAALSTAKGVVAVLNWMTEPGLFSTTVGGVVGSVVIEKWKNSGRRACCTPLSQS